eukprot:m.44059 g.44059  ORF g.44059 m.44059 type:complete len:600 (-) comp6485_c0_seq1:394-2193(-)
MSSDSDPELAVDHGRTEKAVLSSAIAGHDDAMSHDVSMEPRKLDTDYIAREMCKTQGIPRCMLSCVESAVDTFRRNAVQNQQDRDDFRALNDRQSAPRAAAQAWAAMFTKEHEFYRPRKQASVADTFGTVFHESIHSPSQMTILQLEHTYSLNTLEKIEQRDRELDELGAKQQKEMEKMMQKMSQGAVGEDQITRLAAKNAQTMQARQRAWRSEITRHKQELRRDYQDYVRQLWKAEQNAPEASPSRRYLRMDSVGGDDDNNAPPSSGRGGSRHNSQSDDGSSSRGTGMFKRGLGLLRRTTMSGGSTEARSPSGSSGIYRALSPTSSTSPEAGTPLEESFTVHLGTQKKTSHNLRLVAADPIAFMTRDPHLPFTEIAAEQLMTSMALYSSKSLHGMLRLVDTRLSSFTGDMAVFPKLAERSTEFHFDTFDKQLHSLQEAVMAMNSRREATVEETATKSLKCGDVYVTKHSNLANCQVVFHVVSAGEAQRLDLNTRSPIVAGLRSTLRIAFQHGVSFITLPLLMIEELTEEMDVKWQLRRAELVLKCVKGFILENSVAGGDSITVQFLVQPDISHELFDKFSEMISGTFRVSGTMNLKSD